MDDRRRARRAVCAVAGTGSAIAVVNLLVVALATNRDLGGPTGLLVGCLLFGALGLATTRRSGS